MRKLISAGLCLLGLAPPLRAQEGCPGEPFLDSSPRAASLSKFTPVARHGGVVFHSWLDTGRSQPRAHLAVENSNSYPVAVRYRVELRGSRGPMDQGERCVTIRAHEYVLDTGGNTVFAYHSGPLWGVQVSDVRIRSLRPPPEARDEVAPRPAPPPAPPAVTRTAPPEKASRESLPGEDRKPAQADVPDSTPARAPVAPQPEPAADTALAALGVSGEPPATDSARARREEIARPLQATTGRPRSEQAPVTGRTTVARWEPPMKVAGTIFAIVFGALLTVSGAMLLVAIAGALCLLVLRGALHLVRRAPPSRADER
ncbi:MAG TPA: hypothetical protein VHG28_10515 [Longimicrobiaceae bacterium]|nr:hypothetical protein [Longimicrobiaceae bacterium]